MPPYWPEQVKHAIVHTNERRIEIADIIPLFNRQRRMHPGLTGIPQQRPITLRRSGTANTPPDLSAGYRPSILAEPMPGTALCSFIAEDLN
jgi:hypothetical protein